MLRINLPGKMALTKYEKLERGLKALLRILEEFYGRINWNILCFSCYENHRVVGRPFITEQAFLTMMRTHSIGLQLFSSNENLQQALLTAYVHAIIIAPPFNHHARITSPPSINDAPIWRIPWGVRTTLPEERLKALNIAKLEALLYCGSENEGSEWIDWYEKPDQTNTLANQLCVIHEIYKDEDPVILNLNKESHTAYHQFIKKYLKLNPKMKKQTFESLECAPKKEKLKDNSEKATSVFDAYEAVSQSITSGKKRHLMEFQRKWQNELRRMMFEGVKREVEKQETLLERCRLDRTWASENLCNSTKEEKLHQQKAHSSRKSNRVLDRKTYASFLRYFIERFLKNPSNNQIDGEIVLLLWIMIYISKNAERLYPIKQLLQLKTSDISETGLIIQGEEIDFSEGLNTLLREYIGDLPLKRPQQLFPDLSPDLLEDRFKKASQKLLPIKSIPALPESFLIFPHPYTHARIPPKRRKQQLATPPSIQYTVASRPELKRLLEESLIFHQK